MNRRTQLAASAAVLASLTLLGCGGGGADTAAAALGAGASASPVQGVSTPRAVSVVTAKNAN